MVTSGAPPAASRNARRTLRMPRRICPRIRLARSGMSNHVLHRSGECEPALDLLLELSASGCGQAVECDPPAIGGDTWLASKKPAILEAIEGGIERALVDGEHVAGHLLNAGGDGPAVVRFQHDGFEDEQIERTLQQLNVGIAHGSRVDEDDSC